MVTNRLSAVFVAATAALTLTASACTESGTTPPNDDGSPPTPAEIVSAIAEACPMDDPGDVGARRACAEKLRDSEPLRAILGSEVVWGGHRADHPSWNPAVHHTTRFNPRVWRMMYLSQFMFTGEFTVETEGSFTAIRMKTSFRRDMDMGQYPYPLWHAPNKWAAHLDATEIVLVLRNGELVAGYRFGSDTTQPRVEHTWDGRWTWENEGVTEPRVALFTYILSPTNPHLEALNDAYRTLEEEFRSESCLDCHSPDNPEDMTPLVILAYPNQALGDRHMLVDVLEINEMPPADEEAGTPMGLDEDHRAMLLTLAKEFARVGDEALAFEGESTP